MRGNQEPLGKDIDDLFEVDHPLDISFTKDKNYGKRNLTGYASDDAKPRKGNITKQSIDDLSASISISQESILAKMQQTKIDIDDSAIKRSNSKRRNNKLQTSRDVPHPLKRMLTSEFKQDKKKMNDSQSTFISNNQSIRQQIDCLSGLQINGLERQNTRKKKTNMSID